ncbi:MAG: hypothetical protein RLO81_02780 [Fulvivirga sp.]|uniref:hypothetical protein n=1 Tax=Fulvivirga sp. TaxID=1931237 RepID=UPI0032F02EE0
MQKESDWLKSKEVEKELKISSCDLMHLREAGKLQFKKKGNTFLYDKSEVFDLKKK